MLNYDPNPKIWIQHIFWKRYELLLENNYEVTGIDNLNDYYDPTLKKNRVEQLKHYNNFQFSKVDLIDEESLGDSFKRNNLIL